VAQTHAVRRRAAAHPLPRRRAWQTTGGLTPGKQSGIKFIYNAFWAPAACLLAVYPLRRPAALTGLTLYTLVIFGLAMPLALYWPR
jgi:hypothetical protein